MAEVDANLHRVLAKRDWDQELETLHDLTSAIVRLGRVRHRTNPRKAQVFDFVKPDAKSRASILGAAERLAEVWWQLDAAWAPLEDVALEDFDLLVQHCADRKQQSLAAEVTSILAGVAVDESAATLDADLVAWYATATAVFPAETEIGGHIRRLVPTTTVPQPPPGQAEITEVKTAGGRESPARVHRGARDALHVVAEGAGRHG